MHLTVPLSEALVALRALDVLPPGVDEVTGGPGEVHAKVRVHELPGVPDAMRLATRLAGAVDVAVIDGGITGRTWRLGLRASSRRVRLDLSAFVTQAVQGRLATLPAGVATASTQGSQTVVEIDLDRAAALALPLLPSRATAGLSLSLDEVQLGDPVVVKVSVR